MQRLREQAGENPSKKNRQTVEEMEEARQQ
jgi:hypothetical protein